MGIDKLKRVIWRLREMTPITPDVYSYKQIRKAIMEEIGTDERTIRVTIDKLKELKMFERADLGRIKVNKDVEI